MSVVAAVMTGQGMGAIATVQLFGDSAEDVLRKIFRRKGDKPFEPADGRIVLGGIVDDGEGIDEVTVGCEGPRTFAIHCHGNPLIAARIMAMLQRQGVQAVPAEQLLARILTSKKHLDSIHIEAKLALAAVKTIEGAVIITNQVKAGLSEKIRQWQDRLDSTPLEEIVAEAGDILKHSEPARWIISGCTIALIGPPNTGKSALLNTLAGREKAIVSDIRGTTRDWVSAEIHIPPLAATIIDTAGLDPAIAASASVDQAAQQRSREIVERADLVLLILDLSQPASQVAEGLIDEIANRRSVVVLNKADLPPQFDPAGLPGHLREMVRISAKQGSGLDDLIDAVHRACNVTDFDLYTPVAFTDRQRRLLEALRQTGSTAKARSVLSELLEPPPLSTGSKFPVEV
jgi:tRNA modification GTPase